ncbi:hypothetical protein BDN72DRAFT_256885 [Pluteus cervinus]|uniref:Uncharacterized protein n=1 Tax=Pluteus cervinus TaxID=181527 RepID=A0ACD3B5R5_9AGAR|nr:hypothetical protein BDN72DRAFT_256885 [Pluteus cervinus]
MSAIAYSHSPYDGMARSLSRRGSFNYGGTPVSHQGIYTDPMRPTVIPSDPYHQSGYAYVPSTMTVPHRIAASAYDDYREPHYYDDRVMATPAIVAPPMLHPSISTGVRPRRHSSVSYSVPPAQTVDPYYRPNGTHIKFKRKGAFTAGITLPEAQSRVRLSGNEAYSVYELHPDNRGSILLRVRWAGYQSLTYEIPLETRDGRITLSTLARRVARACVHYLQSNSIPIVWDRVELHHLEEIGYGVWQPMLSTH